NAAGFDSRGIVIDGRTRQQVEARCIDEWSACLPEPGATPTEAQRSCVTSYQGCLRDAAGVPVKVFLANRVPPSLLIGETTTSVNTYGTSDSVHFYEQVPLSQ